jgi:xanthine/uracil/vitamin C permease (AzgA family)
MVMAYIIFVNPAILSFAGVPGLAGEGPGFAQTLAATCLVAGILTALMSLVPCNCLQILENAMDPVRTACLHTQAYL